jgi:acetylornithine deacetylase/succinyl-diaminopimelate desuccinylase-like protein
MTVKTPRGPHDADGDALAADVARVLEHIDREELVALALDLGNIDSPPGQERESSDFVLRWLIDNGFEAKQVAMLPERPNVVGRLAGTGGGLDLVFNAHLDVAWGPEERRWMHQPDNPFYTSAWRDGDTLVGNGLVNDKGPLACTLIAAKAIKAAGAAHLGDIIVTGVCGEIGQEPVDEFTAPAYLSKEVGARYLISHGVIGDFAVVAEATDFGVTWVEAGKAFFKVTVNGDHSRYTPYISHPEALAENGNAIVRAMPVVERLERWARDYEARHVYRFDGGQCVPKVNIGAIRGGQPFIPIVTAEQCYLYLDVRITPVQTAMDVQAELRAVLAELDVSTNLECTLYRRGFEADGVEPLLDATRSAHRGEFGTDPGEVYPPLSSMWRDTNPFNELGIPAVTYGPAAGVGGGQFWAEADDFLKATRVYARLALDLCNRPRASR